MNTTESKLLAIINNGFPDCDAATLLPDTSLINAVQLDSLGILKIVVQIENEFDISLNYEDIEIENFGSLRQIAAVINKYLNGGD
ncbi:acyl carrier protein [Paenibacillus sp. UNCCL117]|uniref:acyl carrier protein n=1 Tax=unclassified Paenibacillus TaxID=185978 RepID=UPI000884C60C|nr:MULTISPECIES: acyl carrier protein [unclassified Paenibacillus]SDE61642.1 acyl carrier protein [Paenibacillus sp. cl123]SFW69792.1 acyl carrier protein [Paenibacillus sp. UNCCL117]